MTVPRMDIMPGEGLEVQVGLLLAALEDTTRRWRIQLGEIPDESLLWQPFPDGHNIGAVLLHIADVEAHWIHHVGAGEIRSAEELKRLLSEETAQFSIQWPMPPANPLSWFFAQQDAVRAHTREIVASLNQPEHLSLYRNKEFTLRWLLVNIIAHEAYHGGQAVLLSLMAEKSRSGEDPR